LKSNLKVGYLKQEEANILRSIISRITSSSPQVHTLLQNELSVPLPLHISLSRSLFLQKEQRDEFSSRVRGNLKAIGVKPFTINFSKIAWYPNFERTRWFFSLGVQKPEDDELNRVLGACNAACAAMDQPVLYAAAQPKSNMRREKRETQPEGEIAVPACSESFHISLAWSLETQNLSEAHAPKELEAISTSFDCVKVKIGNTITSLPLVSSKVGSHSDRGLLR
jgi:hypothetical protein